MYLLKEKIVPLDASREEIAKLKQLYGIRRSPEYFLSLLRAMRQLELTPEEKDGVGVIYASHLGPVGQIGRYMGDLLEFPPDQCSPAYFSHSVFNAPAAFLTKYLELQGPGLCVCGFQELIESSINSAFAWLKTSYCARVVVIFSDELTDISAKISELTGLRLFRATHLLLLGGPGTAEGAQHVSPEELTAKIKPQNQGEI